MTTVLTILAIVAAWLILAMAAVAVAHLAQPVADALSDDPAEAAEIDASDAVAFHPGLGRWIVRVRPRLGVHGSDLRSRVRAAELAGACPDDMAWEPAYRVWIVGDRTPRGIDAAFVSSWIQTDATRDERFILMLRSADGLDWPDIDTVLGLPPGDAELVGNAAIDRVAAAMAAARHRRLASKDPVR